jgi:hypothetical protein
MRNVNALTVVVAGIAIFGMGFVCIKSSPVEAFTLIQLGTPTPSPSPTALLVDQSGTPPPTPSPSPSPSPTPTLTPTPSPTSTAAGLSQSTSQSGPGGAPGVPTDPYTCFCGGCP